MKTLTIILTAIIVTLLWLSCTEQTTNKVALIPERSPADTLLESISTSDDSATRILFGELTLYISGIALWEEPGKGYLSMQGDTGFLYPEIGADAENTVFRVQNNGMFNVEVAQCYRNSITVSDEGALCVISGWKHHQSPWESLRMDEKGIFACIPHNKAEMEKFPAYSKQELKRNIRKHCGEIWLERAFAKRPDELGNPVEVSVNELILRFSYLHPDGKPLTRYLVLEIPLGC